MLLCWWGVNLYKSAHFKQIHEDVQINYENYVNIDPQTIWKSIKDLSPKGCGNTSKHITHKTMDFQILAPILEPFVWRFRGIAYFLCDLLFGIANGHPLDRCLIFPICLKNLGAMLLQTSKIQGQLFDTSSTRGTSHTLKNKQGFKRRIFIIISQKSFLGS